jgi:ABC-type transporter Mla subunit MlaD
MGLREKMDQKAERRREEAKALPQIKREVEGVSKQIEGVSKRVKGVGGQVEALQGTLSDVQADLSTAGEKIDEASERAVRVAKTMQARQKDLRTIERAGQAAENALSTIRGLGMRARLELVIWNLAAMSLLILILWGTAGLSRSTLPADIRMTETETADLRELSRIRQATSNMDEKELETYRELIRSNLETSEGKTSGAETNQK